MKDRDAGKGSRWPELRLESWQETYSAVHLWTQMLGKLRVALSPPQNHTWHTALYLTARGLTTGPVPSGTAVIEVELDFVDERLRVAREDGLSFSAPLRSCSVAEMYGDFLSLLGEAEASARIWEVPVEIGDPVPFTHDGVRRNYDGDAMRRCWNILLSTERVLQRFRTGFIGKVSPIHFWWGAFDIAHTRFSGRPAPEHPGGVPNLADWIARDAYSHECMSAGWWPGTVGGPMEEPAFYAYAYPEPAGFADAIVRPEGARYHPELREWVLPYSAVHRQEDPEGEVETFFRDVYAAAASLGNWDREALERAPARPASADADRASSS